MILCIPDGVQRIFLRGAGSHRRRFPPGTVSEALPGSVMHTAGIPEIFFVNSE